MATFTYTPSFEATESSRPNVRKVEFGDGYSQRLTLGLNQNPKEWALVFQNAPTPNETTSLHF